MSDNVDDYSASDECSPIQNQPPMNDRPPIDEHNSNNELSPIDHQPPIADYLIEQELISAIAEGAEAQDMQDLAISLGVLPYHIDWAIEEIVHLEMDDLQHAFELIENDGFRDCIHFLTNKFISEHLEELDNENQ
jgi:hypothetical protein